MDRRGSLTELSHRMALASAADRAESNGPAVLGKRYVRTKLYVEEGKATRRFFPGFGL